MTGICSKGERQIFNKWSTNKCLFWLKVQPQNINTAKINRHDSNKLWDLAQIFTQWLVKGKEKRGSHYWSVGGSVLLSKHPLSCASLSPSPGFSPFPSSPTPMNSSPPCLAFSLYSIWPKRFPWRVFVLCLYHFPCHPLHSSAKWTSLNCLGNRRIRLPKENSNLYDVMA